METNENAIQFDKHVLVCLDSLNETIERDSRLDYLLNNFCGRVCAEKEYLHTLTADIFIYLCGDIRKIYDYVDVKKYAIFVVAELSSHFDENCDDYEVIRLGQIPINVHGMGIYFREFFDPFQNYFELVKSQHQFQQLTESNKPSHAFRKGIYLTPVKDNDGELEYHLLRCSSNLDGPTDNFRSVDHEIVGQVNSICQCFFEQPVILNHVLAQIYQNNDGRKAKIKAHSDKTKDMPKNGVIAFCTFYDNIRCNRQIIRSETDPFDFVYKGTSVLTRLCFKLKECVQSDDLAKEFTVTLYPNSVFIIPLSTNRLYTHEIKPSVISLDPMPIRMGYVIRCAKTKAIHVGDRTYLESDDERVPLEPMTEDQMSRLRSLYYEENTTDKFIDYGTIDFSMNSGDYLMPIV